VATSGSGSQLSRRQRLAVILQRDGGRCVWCARLLDTALVSATTEHVVPKVKGGPSWLANEVAACSRCNSRRGHRTLAEFADESESLGWSPDRRALLTALDRLEAAIAERGGQRRARRYVASQRRRLVNQLRSPCE
jgi:5-methylcytosine-specific restriction endonuclease McrA